MTEMLALVCLNKVFMCPYVTLGFCAGYSNTPFPFSKVTQHKKQCLSLAHCPVHYRNELWTSTSPSPQKTAGHVTTNDQV